MSGVAAEGLPELPSSVAEWEDLLVRFELMPRALAVTLEESVIDGPSRAAVLRALLAGEAEAAEWLQRVSGEPDPGRETPDVTGDADPRTAAERFGSLRRRNFAVLQRRGLDLWEWAAPLAGAPRVTVFQLVQARVREDARVLAELRAGARLGAGAC